MAEFTEVMKQWRRMCINQGDTQGDTGNKCASCPMGGANLCAFEISNISDAEFEEAEQLVTQWAVENPEPVYPTWHDWLVDIGVVNDEALTISGDRLSLGLTLKMYDPIPADIAEKLGIEPKEGI